METIDEGTILKPGVKIKPEFDETKAKQILLKLYGISAKEICELNSYDDRNYLINADKNIKNPNIKNFCADGYVLKVLNSFDSKKIGFIEGQTALSLYLNIRTSCEKLNACYERENVVQDDTRDIKSYTPADKQKVVSPKQLQDIEGKYYSFDGENVIRLYEFIPGKIFCDVQPSPHLFYDAGVYLGKLDQTLKNFKHEGYEKHKTLWMLTSVAHLDEFVNVVNEAQRGMVEDIIKQFKHKVYEKLDEFPRQMIHGDFNEQNILVGKKPGKTDYTVIGFLDFGDTQYTNLLFELSVTLTYMLLTTGEIETGGYFLAGYKMTRLIPENEMKVLKLCVCARLCQSLVLGLYFYQFDKSNAYLLTTQKAGWRLLEDLYSRTDDEVNQLWNSVADEYLTQSSK